MMEAAWMRNGKLVLAGDMGSANITIDEFYHDAIRKALAIPDLTPEQVEVARLEAVLEEARVEGFLLAIHHYSPSTFHQPNNSKKHSIYLYNRVDVPHLCEGDTKLEALRQAVKELEALRKPKLPDVGQMNVGDVCDELEQRAWVCITARHRSRQGGFCMCWVRGTERFQQDSQRDRVFHRQALLNARRIDGDA